MEEQFVEQVNQILSLAQKLGYEAETQKYPDGARIWCAASLSHLVKVAVDFIYESNSITVWSYVRSSSWDFRGERTDIHEVVSTSLAIFLRLCPYRISSSLWAVPHPAIDAPETEIYARTLSFDQPSYSNLQLTQAGLETLEHLLEAIRVFEIVFAYSFDCPSCYYAEQALADCGIKNHPVLYNYKVAEDWAKSIASIVGDDFESYGIQYNFRYQPTWRYYRSIDSKITILFAPKAATQIRNSTVDRRIWDSLDGLNGKLLVSGETKNIIPNKYIRYVKKVLTSLEKSLKTEFEEILLIPLENHFVAVSQFHLVFINRECGRRKFEQERERIQERHLKEANILFPVLSFIWNEKIDDEEFELFIRELLLHENGVMRVRKVGAGREPDGGRDLIVDWRTTPLPNQLLQPDQSPYIDRRIVAQCKAYKGGVSKSAVTDIRDTIDHHDAHGYFLAVSSHITRNLTEHLEKLRNGGKYWVDWWTRSEIEDRLRANRDLIGRFANIVQIKT